ncbi:MAG: hypothetical protein ABL986_11935 [Vicinamibacterales bacterium]
MKTYLREDGFTLVELMTSTVLTLLVLGGAVTAFRNALQISETGQQIADSSHNLRSGANLLIRDLMQAGRKIPTGGIPIPNGAGATTISRPSPPGGPVYTFNNTTQSTLMAVTTGSQLGPTVDNSTTDMITFMMIDPLIGDTKLCDSTLTQPANTAALQSSGSYLTVTGTTSTTNLNWLVGDPTNGIAPIKAGDIIWFNTGGTAIRTVTSVDSSNIYFANGDWFNFNQTAAANGTLLSLRAGAPAQFPCGFSASRLLMYTYYVDATTVPGTPRLTRVMNASTPQALAGVVEDLDLTFDLVDGTNNPVLVNSLPFTDPVSALTYTSTQIRKVNLHVGVRSETKSAQTRDYLRSHVSTVISLRNLAFVDRYN